MLVLTRTEGEEILIGDDVRIFIVKQAGNRVRIGIEAPKETKVLRGELVEKLHAEHTHDNGRQRTHREGDSGRAPTSGEAA